MDAKRDMKFIIMTNLCEGDCALVGKYKFEPQNEFSKLNADYIIRNRNQNQNQTQTFPQIRVSFCYVSLHPPIRITTSF